VTKKPVQSERLTGTSLVRAGHSVSTADVAAAQGFALRMLRPRALDLKHVAPPLELACDHTISSDPQHRIADLHVRLRSAPATAQRKRPKRPERAKMARFCRLQGLVGGTLDSSQFFRGSSPSVPRGP
jgi:hypothetical protein